MCSRVQKRKHEDDHGAEHGNFDIAEIREHEEFTKVKNIERIELGRYEMETWYFSPFPEEFKDCKVSCQDRMLCSQVDFVGSDGSGLCTAPARWSCRPSYSLLITGVRSASSPKHRSAATV
jgi:hypothetical protein